MPRASGRQSFQKMAEVLAYLGDVSPDRVLLKPPPGKATEADLIRLNERKEGLFELVDGILVEKVMGVAEGYLALWLGSLLQSYLNDHDLGFCCGADGPMRLLEGLVRLPDLSFIRWERLPTREIPMKSISSFVPDLAVEVISPGNTRGEIERKLREYFLAGTQLVWIVNPRKRTVIVHKGPDESEELQEGSSLDGGEILPGLSLAVDRIFSRIPRQGPTTPRRAKSSTRRKPRDSKAG